MKGDSEFGVEEFQFVNITNTILDDRTKNTKIARAHAAKINRAKYRAKLVTQKTVLLPRNPSGNEGESICSDQSRSNKSDEAYPFLKARRVIDEQVYNGRNEVELSKFISTIALPKEVQDWSMGSMSSKTRHHMMTVSWPVLAGGEAAAAWFKEFCCDELIHHVSHVAAACHRDMLAGEEAWSSDREMLQHKASALRMLQNRVKDVSALQPVEVERLIFAAVTLGRHELRPIYFDNSLVHLFSPHFPAAQWAGLYSRIQSLDTHMKAASILIDRLGGLSKLRIPAIASTIARVDLVEAGADFRRPRFSCFWKANVSDLFPLADQTEDDPTIGKGFTGLADHMAPRFRKKFRSICLLDRAMCFWRTEEISDVKLQRIIDARNATVHCLLCLPTWDSLPEVERRVTSCTAYEVSKLTCVIYSNAVLFSMFPHNGWHIRLTGRLRWLLSFLGLDSAAGGLRELIVWSCFVGAIVSYGGTQHHEFFLGSLRRLLSRADNYQAIKRRLEAFVWSDNACDFGASTIWNELW